MRDLEFRDAERLAEFQTDLAQELEEAAAHEIDDDFEYCLSCDGSGEGYTDGSTCPACLGAGV